MAGRNQTRKARLTGVVAWFAVFLLGSYAFAQDAVKLSGHWVEPVTVHGIDHGQVRYQIASGRVLTRSTDHLQGLKLARYPGLAEAERAVELGDTVGAAGLLRGVFSGAEADWVRWFAGRRLVALHGELDDADSAAALYIDMVVSGAAPAFVTQPPVDVVARADAAVRLRVAELAGQAIETVGPDRAVLLEQLVEAAGQPSAIPETEEAIDLEVAPGSRVDGLVLSAGVPPGTAVSLFHRGDYDRMLSVAEEALSQPGRTASELYLKGMAQLARAERADQAQREDAYKSAGLSFMRVWVYFPRSAVAGPAVVEAGYVHEKIGRADIAARLYDRAKPLINQREDPAYGQRLSQRIQAVAETDTGE